MQPADEPGAPPTRPAAAPLLGVIGTLAASNVVANRALPARAYLPWNLAVAATVLGIAVGVDGCTADELGLSGDQLGEGARLGLLASAAVAGGSSVLAALPGTRDVFLDARGDVAGRGVAHKVLVEIPLGTVLMEEVAFRGVLPAMFRRRIRSPRAGLLADVASAGLFGLWHVLPSWHVHEVNTMAARSAPGSGGRRGTVSAGVVATAVAGMGLSWLRNRSGSLAAPAVLHSTMNSVGFVLTWIRTRTG